MNRQIFRSLFIGLITVSCASFATRLQAATTVALMSTCGGDAGQNVLALAETALSAEGDITLVDRHEVERVLQEQELMRCGLSEAGQAVTVGQLLGVQVFASLETVPNEKEALGLVVFDATSGVILWDSVLPGTNIEQAAAEVDAAIKASCVKRQQLTGSLTTICILSVRNTDLPREFDSLCQSVGNILQRQLVQSPSLAVLERQHLQNVNKERLLPTGVQTKQLLPSLVLIELEIGRGQTTHGLNATAVLSSSSGAKLGQVTAVVESQNSADLSDRLLIELEKTLKATPSQMTVDRALEAERFASEARFLMDSGGLANGGFDMHSTGFADGLKAIEAANALMPTNTEFQELLVKCLGLSAGQRMSGGDRSRDTLNYSLDLGLRALEISRSIHDRAFAPKDGEERVALDIWHAPEHWVEGWNFWERVLAVAKDQDDDTLGKIHEFQARCRALESEFVGQRAQTAVKDRNGFKVYTQVTDKALRDMEEYAPSSSVWTADTVTCLSGWLALAKKFPLEADLTLSANRMLARLCNQVKGTWLHGGPYQEKWLHHLGSWELQADDYARFDQLFREMAGHPNPLVAGYGQAGQLALNVRTASSSSAEVDQEYRAARDFILGQIGVPSPSRAPLPADPASLYNAALDLIDLLPDATDRQREYQNLFAFMLERKELEYWVVRMVIDPDRYPYRHYNTTLGGDSLDVFPDRLEPQATVDTTKFADNARRALDLFHSPEKHDIDTGPWSYNTGSFDRELIWLQHDLQKETGIPWQDSKPIFLVPDQPRNTSIISVTADSGSFYAVLSTLPSKLLRILRIPQEGGPAALVGEASYENHNYYGIPKVSIPAVSGENVFVGTDKGIFIFSTNDGPPENITTAQGLPGSNVTSVAYLDGKIYASLEGGYLIAYDWKHGVCHLLASSQRHESRSALDNLSPAPIVNYMIPDPDRHRVLFTVSLGINVDCVPQLGLWQIDTTTERVTQLVQLYSQPDWAALMGNGEVLIRYTLYGRQRRCDGSARGVFSYELATGHTRLLSASDQKPAGPKIPATDGVPRMPVSAYPPHVFLDGWLWFANGRVSTNAAGLEYFPGSREMHGGMPFTWKSFHLLGNHGPMAVAGPEGIWLLTLKAPEMPETTSKDSP